jgi:glyoxylase-like metal-dependent hydrolase (beta-lactamase superfamily II)
MRTRLTLAFVTVAVIASAQTPRPPFTAQDVEAGRKLVATSLELRAQIKDTAAPADPFKILGNLYFVGSANGESYLLTSPQGHILMGAGFETAVDRTQKNIEALGFKMSDIKAILLNHSHVDQSGAAAELKKRSGAPVMAGFAEVPYLQRGIHAQSPFAAPDPSGRGGPRYPAVTVDRPLYDGDIVQIGPLKVTAYLSPGHSPSSTSWLYTVRDGGRNYRVLEFCCWEYPDDLSRQGFISEATTRRTIDLWRRLLPIDVYLEVGAYAWSGTLSQPSGTIMERMARLKTDNKLFINRDIFRQLSAAREVEFETKLPTLR